MIESLGVDITLDAASAPGAKLLSSNPHLRDADSRKKSVLLAAASSSAVEGIRRPFAAARKSVTVSPRKKTASS